MKILNWEEVEDTSFEKLPAGGYVVMLTSVVDKPAKEYLEVTYDICEGEHAGYYSDDFGQRNLWAHQMRRSYKETARGMFKKFLSTLEKSNPAFTVAEWQRTSDERRLEGLIIGVVLQYEDYTNNRGEDKERLQVVGLYTPDEIRAGDFKLPDRRDTRKGGVAPASPAPAPAPAVQPGMASKPFPANVQSDDLPF